MVISASRRTDIPAFFSEWFQTQLHKGYVSVKNPFRPTQQRQVSLKEVDVTAFVFWTRNPQPFFPCLDTIEKKSIPYYFMITINHYPHIFEPDSPDLITIKNHLKSLSQRCEKSRLIWRYDPIIISNYTPVSFHKENFAKLAGLIAPYSYRVIISFIDMYRKVQQRFQRKNIPVKEIGYDHPLLLDLAEEISHIAHEHEIEIQTCAESHPILTQYIEPGKCIDEGLLNENFNLNLEYRKDKNQRKHCHCHHSVDIGIYNTCRYNCLYCYAK